MLEAAESLDFEWAAPLRDQVTRLHDSISKALTEVQEVGGAAGRYGKHSVVKNPRFIGVYRICNLEFSEKL